MFVSPFSLVSIYSTVRSHGIIGSARNTLAGAVGNLQYVMICVALGGATAKVLLWLAVGGGYLLLWQCCIRVVRYRSL